MIRNVMLRITTEMTQVKKQKSFPEVPKEAIVQPEQERSETTALTPEQVEIKDEIEYDQMKSAENDMDGDDNPDVDPEA
jgi:hypothetical protein